jgi:hypothetical protein
MHTQNKTNGHQLERAKIEVRESAASASIQRVESLNSQLRSTLDVLTQGDEECEVRYELARVQAQRESLSAVLRVLLSIDERLGRCEAMVSDLHQLAKDTTPAKDWYSVKEVSEILGKAEFTVREWCRLGRVNAAKRDCGRGNSQEWIVSLDELKRIQNEGLLPD